MENNFNKKLIAPLLLIFAVAIGGLLSLRPSSSTPIQNTAAVGFTGDFQTIINQLNDLTNQAKSIWAGIKPTGFRASPSMTTKSLILQWDNVSGADQYLLEKKVNTLTWSKIASVAKDSTSYSDSNLKYSTTYAYRVKASNSYGETAYSPEVVILTPASGTGIIITNPGTPTSSAPVAVNGSCGPSKDVSSVTAPVSGLCSVGASTSVTLSGTNWTWTCAGSNGGTSAVCTAPKTTAPVVTNGTCGSAQNSSYLTAPTSNLCGIGSASSVTLSGTAWNWTCSGTNGGTTAACSAPKTTTPTPINGACGTAQGVASETAPSINLCSTGSTSVVGSNTSSWIWSCIGSNGGSTASCTAPKTTTPPPTPGGKPGADNTGPSNEAALRVQNLGKITTQGAVIENVTTGCFEIAANNVTVRNFRVNGNRCLYGIKIPAGVTGTVLEDGEISEVNGTGIFGSDWTGRRLDIHDIGQDGIKASGNIVLENSWLHKMGDMGTHADGIQTRKGSNFTYRYNNFDMPIGQAGYTPNANFMLETADGASGNIVIDNNWLNGGNATINLSSDGTNPDGTAREHTNVKITNNKFGRDFRYTTHQLESAVTWTNNTWADTGAQIPK